MPSITTQNVATKINEVKAKGFTEKYWKANFKTMAKQEPVLKAIKSLAGMSVDKTGTLTNMAKKDKAVHLYVKFKGSMIKFQKQNRAKKNDPFDRVCNTYICLLYTSDAADDP